jgi:hypothetical protein
MLINDRAPVRAEVVWKRAPDRRIAYIGPLPLKRGPMLSIQKPLYDTTEVALTRTG